MSHEGWKNRETWAMALHIDNGQKELQAWFATAKCSKDKFELADALKVEAWLATAKCSKDKFELADALKEHFEGAIDAIDDGPIILSLATIAFDNVDWNEIAEHLLTKLSEGVTVGEAT